jgi:ABC-type transport system substrate-binding protein
MLVVLLTSMLTSAFKLGIVGGDGAALTYSSLRCSEPPATEWNRTYGGTSEDWAHSVVQTSDGGYALAGTTDSYGAGGWDFWLVKTDSNGQVQWNNTYGGAEDELGTEMIQTSDGGYALTGWTHSYGAGGVDFWLVKTDSDGNAQWNKTYGGASLDFSSSVVQTSDGGYALAGYTYSFGAGGPADFWLVKTDSAGNMQWNKTYGGTNWDAATSLVQTSDGGYAMAGETQSYGAGGYDSWLVKTDSAGNMQWNNTYGGTDIDYASDLVQTGDQGYAMVGSTQSYGAGSVDLWLVKTDSAGDMQWNETYGGVDEDRAFSVILTVDGGYAIAGSTNSSGAGGKDFWLVRTDLAGNMEWNKTYGGINDDGPLSLFQTSDGGYAVAGNTRSYGAGNKDFWLIKTESDTDLQWIKTYGGAGGDSGSSVVQTIDGGYALAGTIDSGGAGGWDMWLVKTDSAGNMQVNKTYGGAEDEVCFDVIQTSDEGYALTGWTHSYGAGSSDSWLVKTDSAGNMEWNKTYGGTSGEVCFSMVQTSDGGYILAGYTCSFGAGGLDLWLVKTDANGNMQWNRTYGGAYDDSAESWILAVDGGYTVAGITKSYGAGGWDMWLVRTDSTGNMQWNKTYGGTSEDCAQSVIQTSDGGYILAGYTYSFGAGASDLWLVKTDANGNMQWNKTYGGVNDDFASSMVRMVDRGYTIVGTTDSSGAGGWDMWLVRTDSACNMQWNKTYGGANDDCGSSIIRTRDGGYALTGWTASFGDGDGDMWLVKLKAEEPIHGPRMDSLYIKYCANSDPLCNALKNGEVDITNSELNKTQMEDAFNDADIQTAISPSFSMLQFDLNNNATIPTYPDLTSPTAYKTFRQGIAYLVNKTHIVNDIFSYAHRIDSPVPRPYGDWWVDWSVSQYDSYGNLLGNYPYEYDLSLADYYFNQSGFVQGNETNPYYNASFPNSAQFLRAHPETGMTMEPLIFYARNDIEHRVEAARTLRDSLRLMGVPVDLFEVTYVTFFNKVVREGDYHVVLGGWSWTLPPYPTGPDFLGIYTSNMINYGGTMTNYVQFRNATYDEFAREAAYPSNLTLAREAALKCQRILVEDAVCVWILTRSRVMGYKNMYGVTNPANSELIDNRWTFLTAQMQATNDTEIRYGLEHPPTSLNAVTNYYWPNTRNCLDRIYDTLLTYSPYDRIPDSGTEPMPWMAEDWEISEWESPYNPSENLTKLTFYLRDGIKWHDGVELNSSDVKFTIDYLRQIGNDAAQYYLVYDVDHVTTPNAHTVVVYENVTGIWTLGYIGALPILPKHVFQSVTNVTGYTPGADEGHPASETLIGSGPWKYVFHNSSGLWLEANRDYFMETPPIGEVDFRYDWEMGCYVVDSMDETMAGEACWTHGTEVQSERWEPGCDVNGDYTVNATDMSIIAGKFNVTWGHSAKRSISPPTTDCTIYIEPSENQVLVGENLTVYVKLANAVNLSGVQFKLNYDNNRLECLNLAVTQLLFGDFTVEARKVVNQTNGFVWVALSLSNLAQPISGNITIATITFHASKSGSSLLNLWNTKLATYGAPGSTCQLMPHKTIDGNVLIGVPTPSGTNVTVAPTQNVNITFTEVDDPGVTTLNTTQPPQSPFVTVNCLDIKTTANYTGNITVQFAYDPTGLSLEQEQAMKIWLWNETASNWIDITAYVNTTSNVIYGETPHLSIFGITSDLLLYGDLSIFGITTVRTPSSPPPPPNGLVSVNYYEVFTTKHPQEPIEIRLAYDASRVRPEVENFIQAWAWNESTSNWTDITTYVNTTSKDVYGITPHLSIFGITCIAPPPNEIAVIDSTCSKNIVCQGYNVTANFTIENQGSHPDFDILVYRNSTVIATNHVSGLQVNTQATLSFTWNTSNWPKGKYGVSACGSKTIWINVVTPGDVNVDHYVGIDDIFDIASHFAQEPGHPSWNPIYDIAGDNYVGIDDIFIAASHFAEEG